MRILRNIVAVLAVMCTAFCVDAETVVLKQGLLPSLVKKWSKSHPVALVLQGEVTSIDLASLKYLPESVTDIDMSGLAIKGVTLKNSRYMERSEFYDGEIPPYALFSTHVKNVKLPASVSIIGEAAFAETPLVSIEFPATVSSIEPRAFYLCSSLQSADLSATSVKTIPEQCFYGCSEMKRLFVPTTVTTIEDRAFMKSGVEKLNIPSVSQVGDYAFAEMPSLMEVVIRNGAKLGDGAFFNDGVLGHITGTPSNSAALAMANTGVMTILGGVTGDIIEEGAYANLKADTIVIHPAVKEIKDYAFRNAVNLKSVDVSEMGKNVPVCSPEAFSGVDVSKVSLVMAKDDEEPWRTAPVWKDFKIGADVTGFNDITNEAVRIDIACVGDDIKVNSNQPINHIEVFSLAGVLLADAMPGVEEYAIGPFADDIVLVRINAGGIVKFVKMMK